MGLDAEAEALYTALCKVMRTDYGDNWRDLEPSCFMHGKVLLEAQEAVKEYKRLDYNGE